MKLIKIQTIQDCPPNATQIKMVLNFAESGVCNIEVGSRGIVRPNIGGTIREIFAQFEEYQQILSQFEITTSSRLLPPLE